MFQQEYWQGPEREINISPALASLHTDAIHLFVSEQTYKFSRGSNTYFLQCITVSTVITEGLDNRLQMPQIQMCASTNTDPLTKSLGQVKDGD